MHLRHSSKLFLLLLIKFLCLTSFQMSYAEEPRADDVLYAELRANWNDIFPSGNRNAGGAMFFKYILDNYKLNNPYKIEKPLIQTSQDPRIQAEGKAGQSTDKGIIFVSENNFESEAGSEWVIGTCVKSPCVAAGNNELVSAYR